MTNPTPAAGGRRSPPAEADRQRAHEVVREWLLGTPAVEAQIRTVSAQLYLESCIAEALTAVRKECS